jgi:small ligand-binding sensory domain FIST
VIRDALRDAPFAGFYTTGEIARVRGASGMHHLTLVTLALA